MIEIDNALPGDPAVAVMCAHRWSDGEFLRAVVLRCQRCGADVLQLHKPDTRARFGDALTDP